MTRPSKKIRRRIGRSIRRSSKPHMWPKGTWFWKMGPVEIWNLNPVKFIGVLDDL